MPDWPGLRALDQSSLEQSLPATPSWLSLTLSRSRLKHSLLREVALPTQVKCPCSRQQRLSHHYLSYASVTYTTLIYFLWKTFTVSKKRFFKILILGLLFSLLLKKEEGRKDGRERNIDVIEKHNWFPRVCAWTVD